MKYLRERQKERKREKSRKIKDLVESEKKNTARFERNYKRRKKEKNE